MHGFVLVILRRCYTGWVIYIYSSVMKYQDSQLWYSNNHVRQNKTKTQCGHNFFKYFLIYQPKI